MASRQYLPKSTDLSPFSQRSLNAIAERLNTRPRQTLGWYTPKEVYTRLLKEYNLNDHAINSLHLEL